MSFFGQPGADCDAALRSDDPVALERCLAKDYCDLENRLMDVRTMLEYCEARGKTACAEFLRSISSKVSA